MLPKKSFKNRDKKFDQDKKTAEIVILNAKPYYKIRTKKNEKRVKILSVNLKLNVSCLLIRNLFGHAISGKNLAKHETP